MGARRRNATRAAARAPLARRPVAGYFWRRLFIYCLFAICDVVIVAAAYAVAFELRFDGALPARYLRLAPSWLLLGAVIYVAANFVLHLYWRGWRYASLRDLLALAESIALATAVMLAANLLLGDGGLIPTSVVLLGSTFAFIGMALSRFRRRIGQDLVMLFTHGDRRPLMIVGAGHTGQWLARELRSTPTLGYRPVCFVDDDLWKQGQRIHGIPVAGTRSDIVRLAAEYNVEVVALAIHTLSVLDKAAILAECQRTSAQIKVLDGLSEVMTDQASRILRDASLDDVLGRPPVVFGSSDGDRLAGETVLITGAAGSIGAELARQIAPLGPRRLALLDINESGLFELSHELTPLCGSVTEVQPLIADVTRLSRIEALFAQYRPSLVFHVAAYKHVPLMESHPREAVVTNVVGTFNVCLAADQAGCRQLVFISTDKAVDPVSVMGATKRVGERIVETFNADGGSGGAFCSVRFGNVLGSRGSVVPTFLAQIRQGGPVTVTHSDMTRFFMTIPEAVNLILEAGKEASGGEIFVLDMGDPVKIVDLARRMIRLAGLRPHEDIEIVEVGLRPGEKLHETLAASAESVLPTRHPRVSRLATPGRTSPSLVQLQAGVERLAQLAESGSEQAVVSALFVMAGALPPDSMPGVRAARMADLPAAAESKLPAFAAGDLGAGQWSSAS